MDFAPSQPAELHKKNLACIKYCGILHARDMSTLITSDDAETLNTFAFRIGISGQDLVRMAIASLAQQIRQTDDMSLPIQIAPSPHCTHCPFAIHYHAQHGTTSKIVPFPQ